MTTSIARVILYVRDIPKVAAFYERHFGLQPRSPMNPEPSDFPTAAGNSSDRSH